LLPETPAAGPEPRAGLACRGGDASVAGWRRKEAGNQNVTVHTLAPSHPQMKGPNRPAALTCPRCAQALGCARSAHARAWAGGRSPQGRLSIFQPFCPQNDKNYQFRYKKAGKIDKTTIV